VQVVASELLQTERKPRCWWWRGWWWHLLWWGSLGDQAPN